MQIKSEVDLVQSLDQISELIHLYAWDDSMEEQLFPKVSTALRKVDVPMSVLENHLRWNILSFFPWIKTLSSSSQGEISGSFQNGKVVKLHITNDSLTNEKVNALAEAVDGCQDLKNLAIRGIPISDEGADNMMSAISCCKRLCSLDLRECTLSSWGTFTLANAFFNSTYSQLILNKSAFCAITLASYLKYSRYLRILDLGGISFSTEEILALTSGLSSCPKLSYLTLSGITFSDEGARALMSALPTWSIRKLKLSDNTFSDEGALGIVEALLNQRGGPSTLDLSNNSLGDAAAVALSNTLANFSQIYLLNLKGNNFSDEGVAAIVDTLTEHPELEILILSFNSIGTQGALDLAHALTSWPRLRELDLRCNSIGDEGAIALASAFSNQPDFRTGRHVIRLDHTELGEARALNN